jgi:transcriptional regulator with XRE-family HTH domain
MNFEAAALAYVRYVMVHHDMTPGALAKAAGISASTLTRALNDPKHKFTLSMKTIEKIATFSNINPAPFLEAKDTAQLTTGFFHRADVYRGPDADLNQIAIRNTLVIGEIKIGKWREPSVVDVTDYGPLNVTSTYHKPEECFAVIMRDDSANMIAENGDILLCVRDKVPMWDHPFDQYKRVEAVVVERRSRDEFKIELSVRFLRQEKSGFQLFSASYEDTVEGRKKKFFEPIKIESYKGSNELSIIGRVDWVLRGDMHDAINYIAFDIP